jgi:hypothetical protein
MCVCAHYFNPPQASGGQTALSSEKVTNLAQNANPVASSLAKMEVFFSGDKLTKMRAASHHLLISLINQVNKNLGLIKTIWTCSQSKHWRSPQSCSTALEEVYTINDHIQIENNSML